MTANQNSRTSRWEESPKLIDAEVARRYLESESIDLSKATELTDEAAKLLPKSQGTEANDWSDKVGWDLCTPSNPAGPTPR